MLKPLPMPSCRTSRRRTESEAQAALAALAMSQLPMRAFGRPDVTAAVRRASTERARPY
jgi:hypothetical protein